MPWKIFGFLREIESLRTDLDRESETRGLLADSVRNDLVEIRRDAAMRDDLVLVRSNLQSQIDALKPKRKCKPPARKRR